MDHFGGLDVSVKETCIVDGTGRMVREVKVGSEPEPTTSSELDWKPDRRRNGAMSGALAEAG